MKFENYASAHALRMRHCDNHVTLVADEKGRIVGMLHLKDACHISMLFVCGEFQRSGVGRALIHAAVEHSQSGTDSVRVITVNSSPNASHAYRRLGFRENGSERTVDGIRFIPMQMLVETGMPPA